MATLEQLRAALTSSRNARVEEIEVALDGSNEPTKLGVKQPSVGAQGRLLAMLQKAAKAEDTAQLNGVKVDFVLECLVDIESHNPIFSADAKDVGGKTFREVLKAQPSGGWIDRVYDVAMRLMSAPAQSTCRAEVEVPANGDKPASTKVCGGALMLGAPKCPWCGADVPTAAEAAERN